MTSSTTERKISDQTIAETRDSTSIVDIVGPRVTLHLADAGNRRGLCPFHEEKTPSFIVSPERNVYFCHGCGAGGDAIKFLMDIDDLTFTAAVERLATIADLPIFYADEVPWGADPSPTVPSPMVTLERAVDDYFRQLAKENPNWVRVARRHAEQIIRLIDDGTAQIAGPLIR